jgi:peptide/nickel transport system substrate-binding protein
VNNLSDPVFIIVDAQAAADNENFKFAPVTTGAFKVTSFDKDTGMTLEKHAGHWSGDIGVDKVNVKYIQDGATRTMALQSGEIDLATQINSNDLTLFEGDENFIVQKGPNLRVFLLRLNMDKPYMSDLKFRQAVRMGMNKKIYAEEIANGTPAKGPFNDMLSFGYKGEDAYAYNPDQAKKLLDEAGYVDTDGDGIREANGENITMKYVSRTNHGSDANNIGIAMQAQLKEIGLSLEVLQVENYKDMAAAGDFDMLYERWTSAPSADGQYFLSSGYETGSAGNYGHYSNPDLDAICEALVTEFDKSERDALSIEGSKILMEDVGTLFLFYQQGNVVTNKKVSGVERFISEIYYVDHRVEVN